MMDGGRVFGPGGAVGSAIRLQKILSSAGIASRRAAERLIADGRVSINGQVAHVGERADPATDDVRVDGRPVATQARHRYILLNKPRGVLSTRSDPKGRKTVVSLLVGISDYLYPVGRLDYDSEGLLLLTNDGDLAERLTHPSHEVAKEYHARVRGVPDARALARLRRGVVIEGRRTLPAEAGVLETGRGARGDQAVLSIAIREGRTHQVRLMCEAVGHPVVRLRRVRIGPIVDPTLRPGDWRDLTPREIAALRRGTEAVARVDDARMPSPGPAVRPAAARPRTARGPGSRPPSPRGRPRRA